MFTFLKQRRVKTPIFAETQNHVRRNKALKGKMNFCFMQIALVKYLFISGGQEKNLWCMEKV